MSMNYYNPATAELANAAAQQTYYDALARGSDAASALNAAKFAWQQKLDEAGQTGMWNGQYNMPTEQWFTGQFGQWFGPGGTPTAGQQTQTAQQQAFNQAQALSQMYGQYYAPGTAGATGGLPTPGQQTQAAQQQAFGQAATAAGLTGYFAPPGTTGQGTQTLAGQQQQFSQGLQTAQEQRAAQAQAQSQAMSYLNLLSNLRGPADWAKYQQVLGSTPGGMRDLYAAAMGQYVPGGGATTGYQPQAASLQSMYGQVAGTPYTGQGGGQLGTPNVYTGQPQGGGQTWGSGLGIGTQQPTAEQTQQGYGGGTNLPAPNQIAAQSWNNMAPSQKQLLLGMYESQGWNKDDVTALQNQSLPKYATNTANAGTWSLR